MSPRDTTPLPLTENLGKAQDSELAERLHRLSHGGTVETLRLTAQDAMRSRLRAETDHGTVCAIALPRDTQLEDGSVLYLDETRAIVVRVGPETWLRLIPRDMEAALKLGARAGTLHWRVRFDGVVLAVAADHGRGAILARLRDLLEDNQIAIDGADE
ncbi:MAG: urease accessory protein UreE [Pseudomonadota bacterium]